MNWYIARIVFQIITGEGNHTPQFDEQLKLISASDEKTALEKALLMGKAGQDTFINTSQNKVEWKFIGVAELNCIHELNDGIELHSKITEQDNAHLYASFIRQKNYDIQSRLVPLNAKQIA